MEEYLAARRRKRNALVGALEQSDAQLFFQLFDLTAERRLACVTGFRCPAEVPMLCDCGGGAGFLEIRNVSSHSD